MERRQALELIAIDGISGMLDAADGDVTRDDVLDYALRCICIELISASLTAQELQETTQPAAMMLGQWLAGMMNLGSEATDEIPRVMHERGRELREHLTAQIGWPRHAPIEQLRTLWNDQGLEITP